MELMNWFLSTDGFVPRAICGTSWTPQLVAATNSFDMVIFLSYLFIPFAILRVYRIRTAGSHLKNPALGILLGMGFILSCGVTHLVERMMFVWPAYHLDCVVRGICATFSLATVLWLSWPEAIFLRKADA